MLAQKNGNSVGRKMTGKGKIAGVPRFTGMMEGDRFSITAHRINGDEDLVSIAGKIVIRDQLLQIQVRLNFTGSMLASVAGSIAISLAAAYMYAYIGERLFDFFLANKVMPYLILSVTALYLNLRRYSNRATSMLEQIIDWLELEEA